MDVDLKNEMLHIIEELEDKDVIDFLYTIVAHFGQKQTQ